MKYDNMMWTIWYLAWLPPVFKWCKARHLFFLGYDKYKSTSLIVVYFHSFLQCLHILHKANQVCWTFNGQMLFSVTDVKRNLIEHYNKMFRSYDKNNGLWKYFSKWISVIGTSFFFLETQYVWINFMSSSSGYCFL